MRRPNKSKYWLLTQEVTSFQCQKEPCKFLFEQGSFFYSYLSVLWPFNWFFEGSWYFYVRVNLIHEQNWEPRFMQCGFGFVFTCSFTLRLFSWRVMMASDILTSIGSTTDSMLNGPSSRLANCFMASVNTIWIKINNRELWYQTDNCTISL